MAFSKKGRRRASARNLRGPAWSVSAGTIVNQDAAPYDDNALVAAARSGDRHAFGELVRVHQDAVFRVVLRTSAVDRSTAEDLAQETFLRAWQGLESFRGECSFTHWVFRIATNLTINRTSTLAAKASRRARSIDAPLDPQNPKLGEVAMEPVDHRSAAPSSALERTELKGVLARALAKIPTDFRTCVVLRDVEGLDYEAIAEVLKLPIGTVRSRLHRGREALRAIVTRVYGVPALEAGGATGDLGGIRR